MKSYRSARARNLQNRWGAGARMIIFDRQFRGFFIYAGALTVALLQTFVVP